MKYLLDTNIIIDHLRGKKSIAETIIKEGGAMSVITLGELVYGSYRSNNKAKAHKVISAIIEEFAMSVLPVQENTVIEFAKIKAGLERSGRRLEDFDILIASTAIEHDLTLITRNSKHFKRIPRLSIAS